MLQSRKSWFQVVIYVLKNLPGTQHKFRSGDEDPGKCSADDKTDWCRWVLWQRHFF